MIKLVKNDVDRLFLFVDPLADVPKKCQHSGKARTRYTLDEVNPEFAATMQRLVTKVKDILDDPKTNPLVENAQDLEARLQVWESFVPVSAGVSNRADR